MKRRQFITLLGGAVAAWPLVAGAQQSGPMRRIGVITSVAADDPETYARMAAFHQGLQEAGWIIGSNVQIEYRWGGAGDAERIREYSDELVGLSPDVILAVGVSTVGPLQRTTRTIPIIFVQVTDPVGAGFVASLARPGGNATGFATYEFGISVKWLELLKEIAPSVTRVSVLRDPTLATGIGLLAAMQGVAPALRVDLTPVGVGDAGEIERAVVAFAREQNGGLIVLPGPLTTLHRKLISTLAVRHICPRSIPTGSTLRMAAYLLMGPTASTSSGSRPATSTAYSRVRSRPTCRCRRRPNIGWSSTSKPRRRSASTYRHLCSPAPTR